MIIAAIWCYLSPGLSCWWDVKPCSINQLLGLGMPGIRIRRHILGNVFSERELRFTFAICHRPSVCLSSVCRMQRSCAILRRLKFSAIFRHHLVGWTSVDIRVTFYGDRHRETPPSGELNTRGVAEYSDFGHIERHISETVQDIGAKLVLITNRKSHMSFRLTYGTKFDDLGWPWTA